MGDARRRFRRRENRARGAHVRHAWRLGHEPFKSGPDNPAITHRADVSEFVFDARGATRDGILTALVKDGGGNGRRYEVRRVWRWAA